MQKETPVDALKVAITKVGTNTAFAEKLTDLRKTQDDTVSAARVWNWLNRDGGAPADFCPDIEALTGVRCERLRPDVNWAVLRKQPRKHKAVA